MMASAEFIGIPISRFLEMTPYYWSLVWGQYLDSEERRDRRAGMLYNLYCNTHLKEGASHIPLDEQFPPRRKAIANVRAVPNSAGGSIIPAEFQIEWARQFTAAYHKTDGGPR